jgi:hypothetical protein
LSEEKIETKNVMGVNEPRGLGQLAFVGAKAYLPFCSRSKRKSFPKLVTYLSPSPRDR